MSLWEIAPQPNPQPEKTESAVQPPRGGEAMPPQTASELAVADIVERMVSILHETMAAGEQVSVFDLPRARVPLGGGKNWDIDGEQRPELVGVIVYRQPVRVYWASPVPTKGTPPSCYSLDLLIGHGDPGGECRRCPYAQWGSAVGADGSPRSGQACKVVNRVFMAMPGELLPLFVSLPPTAHRVMERYILRLASRGLRLWHVLTQVTLRQVQSKDGIAYSEPVFSVVRELNDAERRLAESYRLMLRELLDVEAKPTVEEVEFESEE